MSAGTLDLNKEQYTELGTLEKGENEAHTNGQSVVVETNDSEDVEAATDKDNDGIHGNKFTKVSLYADNFALGSVLGLGLGSNLTFA